ncbi:MAG: ATP-binding protein [Nanoarchaeota archaeon]|nr:ATP-binding protein [Nanoarchaeota archaeon]MBU1632593.1 ATP-binding protein [Nanoarchaeota archaeon]MBU1876114.1 ATP-binding protein [Nanoarchaeota archaeon]
MGELELSTVVEREYVVRRVHAQDSAVSMARSIFEDAIHAIAELVANSHDGDGHNIHVRVSPEELIIEDDGCGMNEDKGIPEFFAIGGSEKKELKARGKKTKEGRTPIGNFGWGSLAVRYLALNHRLDSWKDGVHSWVEEKFSPDDKNDDPINVKAGPDPADKHGTRIHLTNLHYKLGEDGFTIGALMDRLGDEMPVKELVDFDVFVNDQLVTPLKLKNAIEYVVEVDDPLLGKVSGSIFYSTKSLGDKAGVRVKVNNRGVGGLNKHFQQTLKAGLGSKVYGVIYADIMDPLVQFNRSGFSKSENGARLDLIIVNALKQIRQDHEGGAKDEKICKAGEQVRNMLPKMGSLVARALNDNQPYRFVFDETRATEILNVDREERTVYVNPNSSLCQLAGYGIKDVKMMMARLVTHIVGSAMITDNEEIIKFDEVAQDLAKITFPKRNKKRTPTLADILPKEDMVDVGDNYDPSLKIIPIRLYTLPEVTKRTGFSNGVLKRMKMSGFLTSKKEKILGEDALAAKNRLAGKITLFDAVRTISIPEGKNGFSIWHNKEIATAKKLNDMEAGGHILKYVANMAFLGRPAFYVVDKMRLNSFKQFLQTWEFSESDLRPTSRDPTKSYEKPALETHLADGCPPTKPSQDLVHKGYVASPEDTKYTDLKFKIGDSVSYCNESGKIVGVETEFIDDIFHVFYRLKTDGNYLIRVDVTDEDILSINDRDSLMLEDISKSTEAVPPKRDQSSYRSQDRTTTDLIRASYERQRAKAGPETSKENAAYVSRPKKQRAKRKAIPKQESPSKAIEIYTSGLESAVGGSANDDINLFEDFDGFRTSIAARADELFLPTSMIKKTQSDNNGSSPAVEIDTTSLSYQAGDFAVYPKHGTVTVTGIERKEIKGQYQDLYVLRVLGTEQKIMVPIGNEEMVGMRHLMSEIDLNNVFDILQEKVAAVDAIPWNRRYRSFIDKLQTGSIYDVAEVVRDLYRLKVDEHKRLSFGEKRMFDDARRLLVKEIATIRKQPEKDALASIEAVFYVSA